MELCVYGRLKLEDVLESGNLMKLSSTWHGIPHLTFLSWQFLRKAKDTLRHVCLKGMIARRYIIP